MAISPLTSTVNTLRSFSSEKKDGSNNMKISLVIKQIGNKEKNFHFHLPFTFEPKKASSSFGI
jgi:hypothetical protein